MEKMGKKELYDKISSTMTELKGYAQSTDSYSIMMMKIKLDEFSHLFQILYMEYKDDYSQVIELLKGE